MTVRLHPDARTVRAKPPVSPPAKAAWLHRHMSNLETAGMVFWNVQAIHGGVAMAIPKGFILRHGHGLSGRQRHDLTGAHAHAKPGRRSVSVCGRHCMMHAGYASSPLTGRCR